MSAEPDASGYSRPSAALDDPDAALQVLDGFFEGATDLLMLYRPADGAFRFSASWERVLRWTSDEIRALPSIFDLVHPDDDAIVVRALSALMDEGRPIVGLETRLRRADGIYRRLSWNARPLTGRSLVVASARDITDVAAAAAAEAMAKRRAEILAECSLAFQYPAADTGAAAGLACRLVAGLYDGGSTVLLAGDDGLERVAVYHTDTDVSRRAEQLVADNPGIVRHGGVGHVFRTGQPLTVSLDEMLRLPGVEGSVFGDFLAETRPSAAMYVPLVASTGTVGVMVTVLPPDQPPFPEQEIAFLRDLGGRLALSVANADLERRRRATMAELQASEERFRSAFDDAPVGCVITSLEPGRVGQFLRVNPAFCSMVGYRAEQLLTMNHRDLLHPDELAGADEAEREITAGSRQGGQHELRHIRADGTDIWVRVSATLVRRDGRLHHAIGYVEDITDARLAAAELAHRAMFDDLTGLANRHRFLDHLQMALDQLGRRTGTAAVLYIDLDRFKEINDSCGHEAGDAVLVEVGRRLTAAVRTVDTAARLAGDEFAVACPDLEHPDDAVRIAERLCASLSGPIDAAGRHVELSASIGVAVTSAEGVGVDEVLHQADTAMYHAKHRGGGHWELFSGALQRRAVHRQAVEQMLRDALAGRWLRLHYQPVVDLVSGHIVGTESLLRVQHPEQGLLAPAAFIDIAEEGELIVPIGEWVLNEACRQGAAWNERFGPLEMAVNVSGRQVADLGLVRSVERALEASGLEPAALCLEMTERVLIEAGDAVTGALGALVHRGVHLAIDDFGTGYGSITYLKQFPVDEVKIDRSFVADLGVGAHDTAVVKAITALAATLDITIVAEGVETPEQLAALRSLDCRWAQGFHLHRPASAAVVTSLLEAELLGVH